MDLDKPLLVNSGDSFSGEFSLLGMKEAVCYVPSYAAITAAVWAAPTAVASLAPCYVTNVVSGGIPLSVATGADGRAFNLEKAAGSPRVAINLSTAATINMSLHVTGRAR